MQSNKVRLISTESNQKVKINKVANRVLACKLLWLPDALEFECFDYLDHTSLCRLFCCSKHFKRFPRREFERCRTQKRGVMFSFERLPIPEVGGYHIKNPWLRCLIARQNIPTGAHLDRHALFWAFLLAKQHTHKTVAQLLRLKEVIRIETKLPGQMCKSLWQVISYLQDQVLETDFGDSAWHEIHTITACKKYGMTFAYLGDVVVGFVCGPSSFANEDGGHKITVLEVMSGFRRLGIGRELVAVAEKLISEGPLARLLLVCISH